MIMCSLPQPDGYKAMPIYLTSTGYLNSCVSSIAVVISVFWYVFRATVVVRILLTFALLNIWLI